MCFTENLLMTRSLQNVIPQEKNLFQKYIIFDLLLSLGILKMEIQYCITGMFQMTHIFS